MKAFEKISVRVHIAAFCVLTAGCIAWAGMNAWTRVTPSIVLPSGRNGVVYGTSWNGCTYRPSSNSVLFYSRYLGEEFGNTIYGNAMTCWDVEQNRVRVLSIADESPRARHTYESFVYADSKDALYMMFGASGGCGSDGVMWEFSFADNTWRQISTTVPDAYGCEVHMKYWKDQDKVIFMDGWQKMFQYDVQTRVWTPLAFTKNYTGDPAYTGESCWDTKRNLWVFLNGGNLFAYHPVTKVFANLPVTGSNPPAVSHVGITYIGKYDVYLAAGSSFGTWVYDIAGQRWTELAGAGSLDGHAALQYDSTTDLCYYIRGWQGDERRYTLQYRQALASEYRLPAGSAFLTVSPNPFSGAALVRFPVSNTGEEALLKVFDITGKLAADLTAGVRSGSVIFSAKDLNPGVYAVRYTLGGLSWTCRMIHSK